jgi:predicted O-linked N-acetylglucosamine transferase (SPINDLY family)
MDTTNFEKLIFDIDKALTENEFSLCIDTAVKLAEDLNQKGCEQLFLAIRRKLVVFIIEKGVLPPFTLFQLFPMFNKHIKSVAGDTAIENHLQLLKKHLLSIERSSYEYFLFVALIFVLEMFNGEFEKGFNNYLAYTIKSNIFEAYKYPEAYEQFKSILSHCEILADDMVEHIGRILDLDSFFQNDSEVQSSVLLWIMTVIYTEPQYVASPAFFKLEKPLTNIMLEALKLNMLAMAMLIYNVAHHILGNLFQTQKEMAIFNEQFTKPICLHYMQLSGSLPKPMSEHKNKKKIAIIRDRLVNNSPHMVEYSLVKMLMEESEFTDRYDLYIYSVGYIEKELDNEKIISAYQQLGVMVKVIPNEWYTKGYYYNHLEKAMLIRNDIIQEGIDIMIGTVSNNNIIDFLFATRSTPYQIYWSHGNFEYDVPNIDTKITHYVVPKEKSLEYHSFLISQAKEFYNPVIDPDRVKKERALYPVDALVLGTIGRLVKINSDDYLETIAEIMHNNVHTIYLACGSGDSDTLKQKVKILGLEDRFYFPGFVDPHLYGHIIDLYLDTFPLPSGESLAEYAGKGKPYVLMMNYDALSENLQIEHDKFIKAHGNARPFAFSKKDYADVANHLLNSPVAFEEVTKYIIEEHVHKKPGSSAYFREEIENYGAKGFLNLLGQTVCEKEKYAALQMVKKQETDAKALFEEGVAKYRAEFEKIVPRVKDKNGVEINHILFELSAGLLEKRMYYNYFLAEHYFKSNNAEQAKIFMDRAWLFSHFDINILPFYIQIHETLQDYEAIREAYKRLGMEEAKQNNIAKAIAYFNKWHYTDATYSKVDVYKYDFDIIDAIERMAEPYKFNYEPESKNVEGKTKIAFLIFGITHTSSALIRWNKAYLKNLDFDNNIVHIFVVDNKKEVINSLEAMRHVFEFQRMDCAVHLFDDSYGKTGKLLDIAKAIHDFGADILLSGAAMAEFEHTFVIATKPAPKTVGFLLGPPEQFCYPFMDEVISGTIHPLFDAPAKQNVFRSFSYDIPKPTNSISRFQIGISEDAVVLIGAGRYTKFQNAKYWSAIADILTEHPKVYCLLAGVTYEQVSHYVREGVKDKIIFLGWVENMIDYLCLADISLDTYPSGGGYTVTDAMGLGIPIVAFENDFLKKFTQNDWSLAYELVGISELMIERGDFELWKALVSKLIVNPIFRNDMSKKCKKYFDEKLSEINSVSYECGYK